MSNAIANKRGGNVRNRKTTHPKVSRRRERALERFSVAMSRGDAYIKRKLHEKHVLTIRIGKTPRQIRAMAA